MAMEGRSNSSNAIQLSKNTNNLERCISEQIKQRPLAELIREDHDSILENEQIVSWFHGKITRENAESVLKQGLIDHGQIDGLFLVRESTTVPLDFVLSVANTGKLYHFQIQQQSEGFYHIDNGPLIEGLDKIVERHQVDCHGLPSKLSQFCIGKPPPHNTRKYGVTNILHRSILEGNYTLVKDILSSQLCPDINAKNSDGSTALHDACFHGYNDIVLHLLEWRASVQARDTGGYTPLQRACCANKPTVIAILVSKGHADPQDQCPMTGWVSLHDCAMRGHIRCIKTLLAFNAPVMPRTHDGETPYDIAIKYGKKECATIMSNFQPPRPRLDRSLWYHTVTDRQVAVEMFEHHGLLEGLFLMRPSSRVSGWHVLSVCYNKSSYNYEIKPATYLGKEFYYIDDGPYLESLEHIVYHYLQRADGLPCKLTTALTPDGRLHPLEAEADYTNEYSSYRKIKLPEIPSQKIADCHSNNIHIGKSTLPEPKTAPPPIPSFPPPTTGTDSELNIIAKDNIKLGHILGEGEYGSVYKGTLISYPIRDKRNNKKLQGTRPFSDDIDVAIKTFREDQVNARSDFLREATVMQSLEHFCIVKLLGVCEGPPLMMVQEFVTKGSMLDFLWDHAAKIDVKRDLYLWAAQIAAGMMYLEQKHLVHRDLAARNILLESKEQVKISDFGLSRAVGAESDYYRATKGGRWPIKWYAPECVNYGQFSHASDVWSYGVSLWEMFSFGEPPYGEMKGAEVLKYVENGQRLSQPKKCPTIVYDIMLKCWSLKVIERPSFTELNQHFEEENEYASIRELMQKHL